MKVIARCIPVVALLLAVFVTSVHAQESVAPYLTLAGPQDEQLTEGESYDITWSSAGVESVSITASGELTDIPGGKRGRFNVVITDSVPADAGGVSWTVPFLDTVQFRLTVKGYDEAGQLVASQDAVYVFRPDVLNTRTDDGIYIDLRSEDRQRLYVLRDNTVVKAYLTSGAFSNDFYPRNVHPMKPHDHYGVFHVIGKYPMWYSKLFNARMPWALNYWNGHFIHATSPNYYPFLGTAASHGCDRLSIPDARELYDMTPVGTRVEIIVTQTRKSSE